MSSGSSEDGGCSSGDERDVQDTHAPTPPAADPERAGPPRLSELPTARRRRCAAAEPGPPARTPAMDGGRMAKRRDGLFVSGDHAQAPPLQEEARAKVRQAIAVSFGPEDPKGREMLMMLQFVQTLQDLQMFTEKYQEDLVRSLRSRRRPAAVCTPDARCRVPPAHAPDCCRTTWQRSRSTCS